MTSLIHYLLYVYFSPLIFRDGDLYAALRDCHMATSLDNEYVKGYFRLARCLYELEWITEAQQSLQNFMQRFPNYSRNKSCKELETLIKKASLNKTIKGMIIYDT